MKALCDRKSLLAAFGQVSGVAPTKSPKPVLVNAKLECCPDHGSTLIATDLEVGIRRRVLGVEVDAAGSVLLPPRVQQILAASAESHVLIETDETTLHIRAGKSKFTMPAEDPDLFPDVPRFDAAAYFLAGASGLGAAIERTAFCTDVQSTRYALGGVLIEMGGGLDLIATDGRRLAKQEIGAEAKGLPEIKGPVIPVKALKLIDRNLDPDGPPALIAFSDKSAMVRTEDADIYTRLVEGRFPRYQDVFPPKDAVQVKVEMEVGSLLRATEQAAILTSDESRGVDFRFGGGTLTLSTKAADVGAATVELPIGYAGDPVEITFDPRYLTDALKALEPTATVTAELIDHKSAAVFRTEDGYAYVVMPLMRDR